MTNEPLIYHLDSRKEIREFLDCITFDSRYAAELVNMWGDDVFELSDKRILAIFSTGIAVFDSVDDFLCEVGNGSDSSTFESPTC